MMSQKARDIDVALLRAFIAVIETGGMTAASRVLNLTQATISQQIKRLEMLFDDQLFDRSQKKVKLTSTGERLVSFARRMLQLNDEIWNTITAPTFEGEVRLGVPADIVAIYMPPILRAFSRSWPKIQLSLFTGTSPELLKKLADGEIDLTLTTESERGEDLLLIDRLVWAGVRDGTAYRKNPLPVALGSGSCSFRQSTIDVLTKANIDWNLMCHTDSYEPVTALLQADMAVAPFLSFTVPDFLDTLQIDSGLPALPEFFINLHLPASGTHDRTRELARFIRNGFSSRFQKAA